MKLPFENDRLSYVVLECPCGYNNLHQTTVTLYERGEDERAVTKIVVEDNQVQMKMTDGSDNPSKRRHGLTIEFMCEGCEDIRELCIIQHKGETQMFWRETGRKRKDEGFLGDDNVA